MRKWLIAGLMIALGGLSYAQEVKNYRIDLVLSGTPLVYKNSLYKKSGYYLSSYLYFGYGLSHLLEAQADMTRINLKPSGEVKQSDYTLSYTNFSVRNLKIRGGAHYIGTNDTLTKGGYVGFGELSFYKLYRYELGLEGYVSVYPEYPKLQGKGIRVYQINPKGGIAFGNYYRYGSFYLSLKPYAIILSDEFYNKKNYYSLEGSLSYYYRNITLTAFGYAGEQVFPVKSGGFVVYNVAERRIGGGGISARLVYRKASLTLATAVDRFRDAGSENEARVLTFTLSGGMTF